ncbi:MAG TPA: hypothetical protein VFE01_10860, partial [Terracidiphilus sp.]|nr:hypothetical protein [Terracidiphilus sp.]
MPGRKSNNKAAPNAASANTGRARVASTQPPTVSLRWLGGAIAVTLVVAAFCAWGALCLLVWQGSWQFLYHPSAPIASTPASAGIAFSDIEIGANEAGIPTLQGWWIPAAP